MLKPPFQDPVRSEAGEKAVKAGDATFWRFAEVASPPSPPVTEATRDGYRDERLPIEWLLDSQGLLRGLTRVQQRRRVWEAWKYAHGLHFLFRAPDTPYGLDLESVERLSRDPGISRIELHEHGDERAPEAAALVDALFASASAPGRAALLSRISRTLDGVRTTSVRRQVVDVIGAHLIGLDEEPRFGYTGRLLTEGERAAAAHALRLTHSPHALYYLGKFAEGNGRAFQYRGPGGIRHHRTLTTTRRAVLRAVAGMLEDVERNSYYARRQTTWKMREYATDVARLYRRLAALNRGTELGMQADGTHRRLPLPADARRYPPALQRTWSQLTSLSDEQLAELFYLVTDPRVELPANWQHRSLAGYATTTLQIALALRSLNDQQWSELQRTLATRLSWFHTLAQLPDVICARSLGQRIVSESRVIVPPGHDVTSLWGGEQLRDLQAVDRCAAQLQKEASSEAKLPLAVPQRRAVARLGRVLRRYPGVSCVWQTYHRRLEQLAASDLAPHHDPPPEWRLRDEVGRAGGPAVYFQIRQRPPDDPGRVIYELAASLLAAVASSHHGRFGRSVRRQARAALDDLGVRFPWQLEAPFSFGAGSEIVPLEVRLARRIREAVRQIAGRDS